MLPEESQKYIPEVKRAFAVFKEVTGEAFTTIDGMTVVLAIMADMFGASHGNEATLDFINRLTKFTKTYPFIPASYSEADRLKGVEIAGQVEKAWKAMQPPVHTRAIQIVTYTAANYCWQALYGDGCVREWQEMMKSWALQWDAGAQAQAQAQAVKN